MRNWMILASVMLLVVCSGCGGDSHEKLSKESVSTMKEMVSVLEGVKDEASAQSAKPQLKSLMEKLQDINHRQSKLPAPTEAEMKEMDSKYGKEMEETSRKFTSEMMRVMFTPKVNAVFQDLDMKQMK
ncbi:hypothetical protein BH10PLA1_BH10PLA1_17810 [soil metagenome]